MYITNITDDYNDTLSVNNNCIVQTMILVILR